MAGRLTATVAEAQVAAVAAAAKHVIVRVAD